MYTLADFLSLNVTPDIRTMVIETMRLNSQLLNSLVFQPIKSGQARFTRRDTYPTTDARALNAALPAESTGGFDNINEFLAVYSGHGYVDRAFRKFENMAERDTIQQTLFDQSMSITKTIERDIFQGTGIDDIFGLNGRIALIAGDQLFAIGANGLDITASAANAIVGFEMLETLQSNVSGNNSQKVFLMNRQMESRFKIAAWLSGTQLYNDKDAIGNPITRYSGIPFIIVEEDAQGNQILPTTETQGASGATCSSVYCARLDTIDGMSMLTYEDGQGFPFDMDYDIVERVPGQAYGEVMVEAYVGMVLKRDDSVARCTGFIVA